LAFRCRRPEPGWKVGRKKEAGLLRSMWTRNKLEPSMFILFHSSW
jgi:hypothetical protein